MRQLLAIGASLLALAVAVLILRPRFGIWGVLLAAGVAVSVWAALGASLRTRASLLEPTPRPLPVAVQSPTPSHTLAAGPSASVQDLVLAIIGEYRERMRLADVYQAQIDATGGWTPVGGSDMIQRERARIEAAGAARRASAALITQGPAVLEPLLKAIEPHAQEIRSWHASSRAGLDSAFESIFTAVGGDEAQKALDRYRALLS